MKSERWRDRERTVLTIAIYTLLSHSFLIAMAMEVKEGEEQINCV
jgi:hypothetical protein